MASTSLRIDDRATHEVWVIFAEDELARVLIDMIGNVKEAEEWSAEQTRDIGVVHEITCGN